MNQTRPQDSQGELSTEMCILRQFRSRCIKGSKMRWPMALPCHRCSTHSTGWFWRFYSGIRHRSSLCAWILMGQQMIWILKNFKSKSVWYCLLVGRHLPLQSTDIQILTHRRFSKFHGKWLLSNKKTQVTCHGAQLTCRLVSRNFKPLQQSHVWHILISLYCCKVSLNFHLSFGLSTLSLQCHTDW